MAPPPPPLQGNLTTSNALTYHKNVKVYICKENGLTRPLFCNFGD